MSDLPTILADASCFGVAPDVQKKAKAAWKTNAPPALFELVKKTLRTLKSLDWEVSEQLEALDKAVRAAKLAFDVTAFARAVRARSKASPAAGTAFLVTRDVAVAKELLLECLDKKQKRLNVSVAFDTLPDTLFDALPAVRKVCAFDDLEISVSNLTSHRLGELMKGVKKAHFSMQTTKKLPDELFTKELEWLTAYGHKQLTDIPEAIGNAKSLVLLDLSAPKVKKLPKAIAKLPLVTISMDATLAELDLGMWPTLKNAYLKGTIKKVVGHDKVPLLEDYTQKCGMKSVPEALWTAKKLERVWIFYDGFDNFDDVKAKFTKRKVRFAPD